MFKVRVSFDFTEDPDFVTDWLEIWLDLLECDFLGYFYRLVFLLVHFIALKHKTLQFVFFFSALSFFSQYLLTDCKGYLCVLFSIFALGTCSHYWTY